MTRAHLLVAGRVQGVYYRATAQAEGVDLGLTGWVRNRVDGQVEVVVEGAEEAVERFIAWCHRGPPMARVDRVEVERQASTGSLVGFDVRPTT